MVKTKLTDELIITKSTPKEEVLAIGSHCDKSGHCCKFAGGFVLHDDIPKLAKHLNLKEDEIKEKFLNEHESFNTKHFKLKTKTEGKPYGPCVFLGENNLCKIHESKPLHCKVGSCCHDAGEQLSIWFALNHFVNKDDPESIRQWAVYLKTHPTIPGGELHNLVPDKEELKKILSYEKLKR